MKDSKNIYLKPIAFKSLLGISYFDYKETIMIEADRNRSKLYTLNSDSPIIIHHSLNYVEERYCNNLLIRCHKSFIINLDHIETLIPKAKQIIMKNNYKAKVSESSLKRIRNVSEL